MEYKQKQEKIIMNKNIPLAHFFSWDQVNSEMIPNVMSEFRWNGVKNLVFCDSLIKQVLRDPAFFGELRYHMHNQKVNLIETHAPSGQCYDLSCPDTGRFDSLIEDHIKCMGYSVDCGAMTYTMHIGAWESIFYRTPNEEIRKIAVKKLEKLVPAAEKLGIIIAVENSFERSNTPDEVLYYINYFNSPNLKCCFDTGHANIMAPADWKKQEYYSAQLKFAWENYVEQYPDALEKLSPYIVTCHLHDNDGYSDAHILPGRGTIDWKKLVPALKKCPDLRSMQTETVYSPDLSVGEVVSTFDALMKLD